MFGSHGTSFVPWVFGHNEPERAHGIKVHAVAFLLKIRRQLRGVKPVQWGTAACFPRTRNQSLGAGLFPMLKFNVAYEIRFTSSARQHLRAFAAGERAAIIAAVENQLSHEPLVETRNRKRLRPNPIAPWELRVANMRVFYDVDEPGVVTVLAIAEKRGNRLYIEGEEMEP